VRPQSIIRLILTPAAVSVCLSCALAADSEQELAAVRKQIQAVEQRLERQSEQRDASAKALKAAELEVARTSRKLADLAEQVRRQEVEQQKLNVQTSDARGRLTSEQRAFAEQVRVSYMTGRQELFKLLLSQESPARLGRMMVYYDYFNRARSRRIRDVGDRIETLQGLTQESADVERKLDRLKAETGANLDRLKRTRDERSAVLARIDAAIADSGERIEKLKREEQRLSELVVQLGEALAAFPVDTEEPFAQLKGRLAWPVQGRVVGDYGHLRGAGPMRWKGVLLDAPQGTPVRAIYHGRVAFSDWLPGLGLLIIVDHGDGYMSLYAHNEALLKEPGDWVTPGEEIAEVGDSGGRAQPSLYFEIRNDGKPVDPHDWMSKVP
jgi:septal ring factor EnvC (AmiA/AmiB activator)